MPHEYFTADTTTCQITERGAVAIYCGDAPKRDKETGATTHSMRGPLLLIPQDMWSNPKDIAEKVARILNENAGEFFSSAKPST